jgi:hypothetical protein
MDDDKRGIPGVDNEDWDGPKQLIVTLDGSELIRCDILGFRLEGGTQKCSDENCINHIMPHEIVCVTAVMAPPHEEIR